MADDSDRRVARILPSACVRPADQCNTCIERCPVEGAIEIGHAAPNVDANVCDGCGECAEGCPAPNEAIRLVTLRKGRGPIIM